MAASKKAPAKNIAPVKKTAARKKSVKVSGAAFEREKRLTLLMAVFTALCLIFASLVFYMYS